MRLIATDLDGTLLNHKNEISTENAEALKFAQNQGIEVIIATGRTYADVNSICKKAGISTYIISSNGAAIHSIAGEEISSISIDRTDAKEILQYLEENNYYYEISNSNNIFSPISGRNLLLSELDNLFLLNPSLNKAIYRMCAEIKGA